MLKFIRGKGQHLSAERLKLNKELFSFVKTVPHGFPHRPSALCWDPKLQLMAIGTKTGSVRVYGAPGVEFHGKHKEETSVVKLLFLPGQGRLISQCDDSSLHLWELNEEDGKWIMEEVKSCSFEGRLKKITTCCLQSSGEHLLIGTDGGNIYLLDIKSFEMTDHIIYQDMVMQNVPDDYKLHPGSVEAIAEHPVNSDKILIGYNRGLMVLWDNKTLNSENTYIGSQQLESVSWHRSGTKFVSSHNDGSYVVWNSTDSSKPQEGPSTPYGPFPCKAINSIMCRAVKGGDDFIIFSGGMPRASYADKHTVTIMCGDKHQVLDFTSKVVDFFTICHGDEESDFENPHALVVLAEEELVAIDLDSEDWLPFRLPYLSSLHSSAITCSQHCSDVPQDLWNKIITAGNKQVLDKYTEREWPILGGSSIAETPTVHDLLLTGHEDGTVRFWDASGVALSHIYTLHTANLFDGEEQEQSAVEENEEWPPFRKVGSFDPYSDDPRLAVKKIVLCVLTGSLVVAGTAGQIVIMEMKEEEIDKEIETMAVNIVSDRDNFIWKGHDQLTMKQGSMKFEVGFQPMVVTQLSPPAAVTAIALHSEWGLIAAGTAHGFGLFDFVQRKPVMSKCTLNPNDLIATGDAAMSRRKSFKKSLRESFRRLRKGRSQRGKRDKTPTRSPPDEAKSSNPKEQVVNEVDVTVESQTSQSSSPPPTSPQEPKPVERQVEARSAEDNLGSMVRCLYLAQSFIINNAMTTSTLWAGTNAGGIFVFTISRPSNEKREVDPVTCQLGKEIQLKHRAPVISIQILDGTGHPLPDPLDVQNQRSKAADLNSSHRVLICSEEQFKVFTLPSLKPYCKFKLTAHEGSRVRKVGMINFRSKSDENYSEHCMACLSNQGDISIFSVPDLRRQQVHQCLKREDINGISSVVFTRNGQGFHLHSPCEFQRFTLSARHITDAAFKVDLPENARPQPVSEVEEKDVEVIPNNANETKEEMVEDGKLDSNINTDQEVKTEEKLENTDALPEANISRDEEKKDLDITVDSVKDHLASLSTEESTMVVEKEESTRIVKTQETVTKVTSMSVTKETVVNSAAIACVMTAAAVEQASEAQVGDNSLKSGTVTICSNSSKATQPNNAPTALLEEFNQIDEDCA